jgi:hypothetical protein
MKPQQASFCKAKQQAVDAVFNTEAERVTAADSVKKSLVAVEIHH